MADLAIVGSEGLAKEIYSIIKELNTRNDTWNVLGFVSMQETGTYVIDDYRVVGNDTFLMSHRNKLAIVIAIGNPQLRCKLAQVYQTNHHLYFPNIIHPGVIWDQENIEIGQGNIICAGTVISPDVRVGNFNIINMSSVIAHDSTISDCCSINPGANISGDVSIGDRCTIGASAVIHQGVLVKERSVLGLGGVLTRNTTPDGTYLGNPAKKIG